MDESERVWNVLVAWEGAKEYTEFKEFARRHPEEGYAMAWRRIVEFKSEYRGALTYGLLSIMADIDRARLQSQIQRAWPELDEEHRETIAICAHDASVLELSDWICLCCDEYSSVRVRHRILSGLFGGDYAVEFRRYARACVRLIGDYTDNEVLSGMLRKLKVKILAHYGLADEVT